MRPADSLRHALTAGLLASTLAGCTTPADGPSDAPPRERATAAPLPQRFEVLASQTLEGVGAAQGVTVWDGMIYVLGDADTGVIRAFTLEPGEGDDPPTLVDTGRTVTLTRGAEDWLPHPTGLAIHPVEGPGAGVWLGDTVRGVGVMHLLDWNRAHKDGDLRRAVRHTVVDDLAVNGTRPEWVRDGGRWLIATSDYGPEGNEIRLYDPDRLGEAGRTSAPGVLVRSIPCGPFVQGIRWLDHIGARGRIVLIQNITPGLGYRLTVVDPAAADARTLPTIDLATPTDELEGWALLDGLPGGDGYALFVSSSRENNAWIARVNP